MGRDYAGEAVGESAARDAMFRWVKARTEAVLHQVTAHEVLRRNGISLRHNTDREEQFPCPFHGVDRHPSARVYPASTKGPSHVWCFVCQKHWDAIGLWRMFAGGSDVKFTQALAGLERAFGLLPPERPPSRAEMEEYEDPEALLCEQMFDTCERLLALSQAAFDLKAHLTVGAIVDRVRFQFESKTITPERTRQILQQVLDKISAKNMACLAG